MIINKVKFPAVDFKKYKRVFIFGCSFTNYIWPTWANILCYDTDLNCKVYNFGTSGAGNLYITERISAANQKFKFSKDDLVLVMWTTFSREDRYIGNRWETPGNIWTQGFYPNEWIVKYTCVRGYLVRDLGLMSATVNSLEFMPCDAIVLKAVDPSYDEKYYTGQHGVRDVIDLYKDMTDTMPNCLHNFANDGHGGWINGHHYHWPVIKSSSMEKPFSDYHPNPGMYLDYITSLGFNISEESQARVQRQQIELKTLRERQAIEQWFNQLLSSMPNYSHWESLI